LRLRNSAKGATATLSLFPRLCWGKQGYIVAAATYQLSESLARQLSAKRGPALDVNRSRIVSQENFAVVVALRLIFPAAFGDTPSLLRGLQAVVGGSTSARGGMGHICLQGVCAR
jgi:hypothetical protein